MKSSMGIQNVDTLAMLCILQLHKGKSIILENDILVDKQGINDITKEHVLVHLNKTYNQYITLDILRNCISNLIFRGHLKIIDNRMCPSIQLIHYYIEILQYGEDDKESLVLLDRRMKQLDSIR